MLCYFKFNMPSQKSDNNNSITIIFIKTIIEINIIKISIKNTHFFTNKYGVTRIFIKVEYIFICIQSIKIFFNHFIVTKESGISFNAARESSTASSHNSWVLKIIRSIYYKKESSETTLSHISWVLYWPGIESNKK